MKATCIRFIGSAFGATIITICLFIFMTLLIRSNYTPPKDERVREYKTIKKLKPEILTKQDIKLRPELKKSEEAPPSPPKSTNFARKRPAITPTNASIQAIINPLKPKINSKAPPAIFVASEILVNTGIQGKPQGQQSSAYSQGESGTSAQGNTDGGNNQCSMSFTLVEGGGVGDLAWLNCVDTAIADEAKQALYVWLRQKNKDFIALNAQPGDSLEFTFQRRQ